MKTAAATYEPGSDGAFLPPGLQALVDLLAAGATIQAGAAERFRQMLNDQHGQDRVAEGGAR